MSFSKRIQSLNRISVLQARHFIGGTTENQVVGIFIAEQALLVLDRFFESVEIYSIFTVKIRSRSWPSTKQ